MLTIGIFFAIIVVIFVPTLDTNRSERSRHDGDANISERQGDRLPVHRDRRQLHLPRHRRRRHRRRREPAVLHQEQRGRASSAFRAVVPDGRASCLRLQREGEQWFLAVRQRRQHHRRRAVHRRVHHPSAMSHRDGHRSRAFCSFAPLRWLFHLE